VIKPLLITLYQGHYHIGAGALINSAIRHGFNGRIALYHENDRLAEWTRDLTADGPDRFRIGDLQISFHRVSPPRHLGYHKPFAMRQALADHPDCDAIVYADPDVLFLAPWSFFDDWIKRGVAYCLDGHFPYLPAEHPWRANWKELIGTATGLASQPIPYYPNSGFIALPREQAGFLDLWAALTEQFEKNGGDTKRFRQDERYHAITGDQDLMAAALMAWTGPVSILGPEAMGFTEYYFILCHDIGPRKTWQRNFVAEAVDGYKPSRPSALFLEYADHPLPVLSPSELASRRRSFNFARIIGRFWKR
jgi:hypothetical protein